MGSESGKHAAKSPGIGYLVFGLVLLCGAVPLWWLWISRLVWTRGYDLRSPLLLIAIVVSAAAICPPALLFVAHFLSRRRRRGRVFHELVVACAVGGVLTGLVAAAYSEILAMWGWHVTNPKRYEEMLSTFPSGVLALSNHFPRAIPPNATRVRFSCGHVIQGPVHLQLRVKLPREEVESILAMHKSKALAAYPSTPGEHDQDVGACFHTGDATEDRSLIGEPFPGNYEIVYLGPFSPEQGRPPCGSSSYGLAVDVSASEVVYWSEAW